MNNNYPPGVTGNEPQICGTGLEDKCTNCVEKADEETTLAGIPDGEYEIEDKFLCTDCAIEEMGADDFEYWREEQRQIELLKQKG